MPKHVGDLKQLMNILYSVYKLRSAFFRDFTRRRVVIVYGRFGTMYRSHLHGSRVDTTPRNTPEERRSHQHRDGSLKSLHKLFDVIIISVEPPAKALRAERSPTLKKGAAGFPKTLVRIYETTLYVIPGDDNCHTYMSSCLALC
jgi:hypothetical protein